MLPSEFLLSYASFNADNKPFVECQVGDKIERHELFGQDLSLEFDFSVKYCTGWVDFENRCSQICPDYATVDEKYENCLKCRDKTGFNPAFYNAQFGFCPTRKNQSKSALCLLGVFRTKRHKSWNLARRARNSEIIGAGSAISHKISKQFSSALIARQYEAKISKLDGIAETLPVHKKMELIKQAFNRADGERELRQKLLEIEQKIGVSFPKSELITCEDYFQTAGVDLSRVVLMKDYSQLVGHVRSVIGSIVITDYDGQLLAYNIKSLLAIGRKKLTEKLSWIYQPSN